MRRFRAVPLTVLLLGATILPGHAQKRLPVATSASLQLTVDTIMRGPDLVGYPPTSVRWSADSQRLYFAWRRPGEKEDATYVVGRDGGEPRKLSDAELKSAPP